MRTDMIGDVSSKLTASVSFVRKPEKEADCTLRSYFVPEADAALPPVHLAGKMTADGYQPENWQWLDDVLKEAASKRTDRRGAPRRVGRDPMTIPVETCAGVRSRPKGG